MPFLENTNKRFFTPNFCAYLFLACTTFIFAPLEIFLVNSKNLWFGMSEILPLAIIPFLIFMLLILLITRFIPCKYHHFLTATAFGLSLAIYLQGNFLQINYGTLNGVDVLWEEYTAWSIINTLIWALIIIFPFLLYKFAPKLFEQLILFISIVIVLLQMATLMVLFISLPSNQSFYVATTEGTHTLSDNQNIVVFLLDCFDSSTYHRIVGEDDTYRMDDFVSYDNVFDTYPTTEGALPMILTGKLNNNSMPKDDYLEYAFASSELYVLLNENNYDIGIYTDARHLDPEFASSTINVKNVRSSVSSYTKFAKLTYKFVSSRYFPHVLKKYVWIYSADFETVRAFKEEDGQHYSLDNMVFYSRLHSDFESFDEQNAFRFYHIMGDHPPFTHDEYLNPSHSADIISQAKGSINIVKEYIEKLKDAGIYENTMIVITADHSQGSRFPLLLIKQPDTPHSFEISSTPLTSEDVYTIILNIVKGIDAVSWTSDDDRMRVFMYYEWTHDKTFSNYLPTIYKSFAYGSQNNFELIDTGLTYSAGYEPPLYELGTIVEIDSTLEYYNYVDYGLWNPDQNFSWAVGKHMGINFMLNEIPDGDLTLTLNYETAINDSQRALLYVEEQMVGEQTYSQEKTLTFNLPQDLIDGNYVNMRLYFPEAVSPNDEGINSDLRLLSFGISSIVLS